MREEQVTRTVEAVEVELLCLDLETKETFTMNVKMAVKFKNFDKLFKQVEKKVNSEKVKAVHIIEAVQVIERRGMTLSEFIEHSEVLPPLEKAE